MKASPIQMTRPPITLSIYYIVPMMANKGCHLLYINKFCIVFELNIFTLKLYSWTFKFRKIVRQQIWGVPRGFILAFPAVFSVSSKVNELLKIALKNNSNTSRGSQMWNSIPYAFYKVIPRRNYLKVKKLAISLLSRVKSDSWPAALLQCRKRERVY